MKKYIYFSLMLAAIVACIILFEVGATLAMVPAGLAAVGFSCLYSETKDKEVTDGTL